MKEDFFKVGYSTYIQKQQKEKTKWTSRLLNKIIEHKFLTTICLVILTCMTMNMWLIYKFINILHII